MPRILLQQGTNLVNKFALLLHKCRFAQDSRDKPENDGSWRCWLSICCKLFNYPSPDTTVSTDKPSKGLDVVRQYAALLERRVQSSTRVRKAQVVTRQTNPIGRSMIEMLGVLAIIGVLSVGGIAGYSKAMTKFKTNKVIDQVASIVVNAMTLYSTQKKDDEAYYVNITPEIEKLIYPQDVFSESGDKKHALGGDIDFFIATDNFNSSSSNYGLMIFLDGLSKSACLTLATNDWGKGSFGFSGLQIVTPDVNNEGMMCCYVEHTLCYDNGTFCKYDIRDNNPFPLTIDKASQLCEVDDNYIVLLFEF